MIPKTLAAILLIAMIGPIPTLLEASENSQFDSPNLRIRLSPRTAQQIAAFYEARGFGQTMLTEIKKYCFITVYIRNKGKHILWHDLNNWHFTANGKILQRIKRDQFKKLWETMNIPLAHQSIFRWTLLPEQLDFQPNEGEGGNIVLPWTNKGITIQAVFNSRERNSGKPISVKLDDISCQQ